MKSLSTDLILRNVRDKSVFKTRSGEVSTAGKSERVAKRSVSDVAVFD